MLKGEDFDFCECNAISIIKFLSDNFSLGNFGVKKNARNRHWRLKHKELAGWPGLIIVPIPFAVRYKELVKMGKLIVVKDDYGFFKVYINPHIILECSKLPELEEQLKGFEGRILDADEQMGKELLESEIADLYENIRIIQHFHGSDSLDYTEGLICAINGTSRVRRCQQPQ